MPRCEVRYCPRPASPGSDDDGEQLCHEHRHGLETYDDHMEEA